MRRIIPSVTAIALFFCVWEGLGFPLPLESHSFRSLDQIPAHEIKTDFTLFHPQHVKLAFTNRANVADTSALPRNRFLVWLADSIAFDNIHFNFRIRVDQKGGEANDLGWVDPDVTFGYDPDRIVMDWRINEMVSLKLGKDRLNWGPLKLGGLLLSDYNRGFTMVHQKYKLGPFVLQGLFSQINTTPLGVDGQHAPSGDINRRFFSASRLEWCRPRYGFALGQAIVYAGESRNFELEYMLPFYVYHYGQMSNWRMGNEYENTFGSIDGYWWLIEGRLQCYGELLIDDIQGDLDARSQSVQNNIGFMVGIEGAWWLGFTGFLEGGQINSFVYNHVAGERLRYQIEKGFIGSPIGPDQRFLWGKMRRTISPKWEAGAGMWLRQSGERDIGHEYDNVDVYGTRDDKIPFGIVQTETAAWLESRYVWRTVSMDAQFGFLRYTSYGHQSDADRNWPFFSLSLSTGISILPVSKPPASVR